MKDWLLHVVKIVCFLHNGLGILYTHQDALSYSNFVKTTLIDTSFVPNVKKSVWTLCQNIIWLGIEIEITQCQTDFLFSITWKKIQRVMR